MLWKQKIKQARNKDIWWKQNRKGVFFEVLYGGKKKSIEEQFLLVGKKIKRKKKKDQRKITIFSKPTNTEVYPTEKESIASHEQACQRKNKD